MTALLREELTLAFNHPEWKHDSGCRSVPQLRKIPLYLFCNSLFLLPSHIHQSCSTQTSFLILHLSDEMSHDDCLSPIGLDCCNCCLDLANGCVDPALSTSPSQGLGTAVGLPASPSSPSVNHFRQLRNQLMYHNLNTDKLNNIMRQDSLESVVRDPCFLLNEGICNSNIDQTMLSILLFFHRYVVVLLSVMTEYKSLSFTQRLALALQLLHLPLVHN